jgi:hypothetical protein
MMKKTETISGKKIVGQISTTGYEKYISRRSFLNFTLGTLAGLTLSGGLSSRVQGATTVIGDPFKDSLAIPPLFCTAYITPDASGQGGQEAIVARYPLALVPQDMRIAFVLWRDKVKSINPKILLFGYQMCIEETTVPGPGHDKLRTAQNSWCVYPDGSIPTFINDIGQKPRLYDPRSKEWQSIFIEACRATLSSYPYGGLFIDQCTIFNIASTDPSVREEMRAALQSTLMELRRQFPNTILVGNSSYSWAGLNGELNEGRQADIPNELAPFAGHVLPRVELVQTLLNNATDIETVKREMDLAHGSGGFYGACVNYQHALWFDVFDNVIATYNATKIPNAPAGLTVGNPF